MSSRAAARYVGCMPGCKQTHRRTCGIPPPGVHAGYTPQRGGGALCSCCAGGPLPLSLSLSLSILQGVGSTVIPACAACIPACAACNSHAAYSSPHTAILAAWRSLNHQFSTVCCIHMFMYKYTHTHTHLHMYAYIHVMLDTGGLRGAHGGAACGRGTAGCCCRDAVGGGLGGTWGGVQAYNTPWVEDF